jgi:glycosyltransferase involved in cell wall biosynthesis
LLIGYFSAIKNQRSAIRVASSLKGTGYQFLFVGRKSGRYYKKCRAMVDRLGLTGVVTFKEDSEIALADELASSVVVMSTSVTEALPINLVEAMAAGTPFVSYQVGAVPSLHGGVCVRNEPGMSDAIMRLVQDEMFWGSVSRAGRSQYKSMFTYEKVRGCLGEVVNSLVRHC